MCLKRISTDADHLIYPAGHITHINIHMYVRSEKQRKRRTPSVARICTQTFIRISKQRKCFNIVTFKYFISKKYAMLKIFLL